MSDKRRRAWTGPFTEARSSSAFVEFTSSLFDILKTATSGATSEETVGKIIDMTEAFLREKIGAQGYVEELRDVLKVRSEPMDEVVKYVKMKNLRKGKAVSSLRDKKEEERVDTLRKIMDGTKDCVSSICTVSRILLDHMKTGYFSKNLLGKEMILSAVDPAILAKLIFKMKEEDKTLLTEVLGAIVKIRESKPSARATKVIEALGQDATAFPLKTKKALKPEVKMLSFWSEEAEEAE